MPPRWLSGKESAYQCRRHKRHGFNPWDRKIPWRRKWQPTSVFLAWKIPWGKESGGLQFMGSQRVRQTEHVCTHAKTKVRPEMPTKNGHKESCDICLAFQIPRSHCWWNQVQTLDVRLISTNSISFPRSHPKQDN